MFTVDRTLIKTELDQAIQNVIRLTNGGDYMDAIRLINNVLDRLTSEEADYELEVFHLKTELIHAKAALNIQFSGVSCMQIITGVTSEL